MQQDLLEGSSLPETNPFSSGFGGEKVEILLAAGFSKFKMFKGEKEIWKCEETFRQSADDFHNSVRPPKLAQKAKRA